MSAVIIPVVGNGVVTTLDDLLKVLPVGAQNLQWMVSCDFEVVANEERARARAEAIYALADRAQPVPFENLVALAAAGVQVIDGELVAFGQDGEDPLFIIRSVRGDEWDLEAANADVIALALERLPGGRPHPEPRI